MEGEGVKLRDAKIKLEEEIARGGSLTDLTERLGKANEDYKSASAQVKKHTVQPKSKAKAKAKAD